MAVERLLRSGFQVAVPLVDEGYDLIAFDGRRCWRIQVKATASRGRNASRIRIKRGHDKSLSYELGQIDAFIVAHVSTGTVMCVPLQHVIGRSWINFSQADKYSDFNLLRKLKQTTPQ